MKSKILPYPFILWVQILIDFLCILLAFGGPRHIETLSGIIFVSICSSVGFIDFLFIVLSLTLLWNVPLTMTEEGIKTKDKIVHKWSDVTDLKLKQHVKLQYGHAMLILSIHYSDGSVVRFDFNQTLWVEMNNICKDKEFLKKAEDCIVNFGDKLFK